MKQRFSPLFSGIAGLAGMTAFYYTLLALVTGDPAHPAIFFADRWYLLGPLFLGFGAQMYLFQKIRAARHALALKTAGASAGMSGVAMAACCAHHLADLLPVLGFLGAAAVVSRYQDWFLALGVAMNLAGAAFMLLQLRGAERCAVASPSPQAPHV